MDPLGLTTKTVAQDEAGEWSAISTGGKFSKPGRSALLQQSQDAACG